MTMIKCKDLCYIVIVYYMTIFIIVINGKSILFGKSIIQLNGNIKIPVFVPISWLIHDIKSAKMIGHKSDAKDMMTSDMTPDMNGNFERQPSDEKPVTSGSAHRITNRVSDTQTLNEKPKEQDLIAIEEPPKEMPQQIKDIFLEDTQMRHNLESDEHKFIAKQRLKDEIMYEPNIWSKEVDPLFTTIEIYEAPGASNILGLASNRTIVHKAPNEGTDKNEDKMKIRLKPSKVRQLQAKESKIEKAKIIEPKVKVSKNNNYYFKNYLNTPKNKYDF